MTNPTEPDAVCPECNSEVLPTQYCMMGHWCGKPVVPTVNAHDVPVAELRAQLAQAQRELAEAKANGKRYLDRINELTKQCDEIYKDKQGTDRILKEIRYAMHLDVGLSIVEHAEFLYMYRRNYDEVEKKLTNQLEKMRAEKEYWAKQWAHLVFEQGSNQEIIGLKQERDLARADCKLHMESFLTVANAMGMPEAHPQKIANEIAALRAEAASLRAQLAERHTLADMAAGLLAEKANADEKFQEIMDEALKHRDEWPTMKPRPEAEGREG